MGNLVFMQHKGEEGLEEEVDRLLRSTGELETEIAEMHEQIVRLNPSLPHAPVVRPSFPMSQSFVIFVELK